MFTARKLCVLGMLGLFIGAAPAGDYLLPGNSTPPERALNRAVLLRLPFEELRQAAEVDKYSEHTVRFWQLNKTGGVDDVVDSVLTAEERKKIDQIAADPEIAAAIERDVQLGTRTKVTSTPTMIITHNGKPQPVVGAVGYATLSAFLDSLLGPAK